MNRKEARCKHVGIIINRTRTIVALRFIHLTRGIGRKRVRNGCSQHSASWLGLNRSRECCGKTWSPNECGICRFYQSTLNCVSYPFCVTPTFRKVSKSMKTRKTVFKAICSIPVLSMHGWIEEISQRTNGEKHPKVLMAVQR